jgi:hypothetical protein
MMAWGWSHSPEAYANAEANLRSLPPEDLAVIFAEWRAAQSKGGVIRDTEDFCLRKYERALTWASRQDPEHLADWIWDRASDAATCDNGGFHAWVCPSGCHCVSFDSEGSEDAN